MRSQKLETRIKLPIVPSGWMLLFLNRFRGYSRSSYSTWQLSWLASNLGGYEQKFLAKQSFTDNFLSTLDFCLKSSFANPTHF